MQALRLGVDDYLLKPFHEEELRARFDNLLRNVQQRKVVKDGVNAPADHAPRPIIRPP